MKEQRDEAREEFFDAMAEIRMKAEYGDYLAYTCAALRNESISDLVWNIDKCDWQEVAIADIKLMLHFQTTFDRFHEFRDMLCCSADFWHHLS